MSRTASPSATGPAIGTAGPARGPAVATEAAVAAVVFIGTVDGLRLAARVALHDDGRIGDEDAPQFQPLRQNL